MIDMASVIPREVNISLKYGISPIKKFFFKLPFLRFYFLYEREHFGSVCMPSIWGECVCVRERERLTSNDCKQKMESTKKTMFNILSLFPLISAFSYCSIWEI